MNLQPKGELKNPKDVLSHTNEVNQIFIEELLDLYWAERALGYFIPKMIQMAGSSDLVSALTIHHAQTQEQVIRIEAIIAMLGTKRVANTCQSMKALISEAREMLHSCVSTGECDEAICEAIQNIGQYEIATYGILLELAQALGLTEAVALLQISLDEEYAADDAITDVAISFIGLEKIDRMFAAY